MSSHVHILFKDGSSRTDGNFDEGNLEVNVKEEPPQVEEVAYPDTDQNKERVLTNNIESLEQEKCYENESPKNINNFPEDWSQDLAVGDLKWIRKTLFNPAGELISSLTQWYYPPDIKTPSEGTPDLHSYLLRRLFMWMPKTTLSYDFKCPLCNLSLESGGLFSRVCLVLDFTDFYYLATECLHCSKCNGKYTADDYRVLDQLPRNYRSTFPVVCTGYHHFDWSVVSLLQANELQSSFSAIHERLVKIHKEKWAKKQSAFLYDCVAYQNSKQYTGEIIPMYVQFPDINFKEWFSSLNELPIETESHDQDTPNFSQSNKGSLMKKRKMSLSHKKTRSPLSKLKKTDSELSENNMQPELSESTMCGTEEEPIFSSASGVAVSNEEEEEKNTCDRVEDSAASLLLSLAAKETSASQSNITVNDGYEDSQNLVQNQERKEKCPDPTVANLKLSENLVTSTVPVLVENNKILVNAKDKKDPKVLEKICLSELPTMFVFHFDDIPSKDVADSAEDSLPSSSYNKDEIGSSTPPKTKSIPSKAEPFNFPLSELGVFKPFSPEQVKEFWESSKGSSESSRRRHQTYPKVGYKCSKCKNPIAGNGHCSIGNHRYCPYAEGALPKNQWLSKIRNDKRFSRNTRQNNKLNS